MVLLYLDLFCRFVDVSVAFSEKFFTVVTKINQRKVVIDGSTDFFIVSGFSSGIQSGLMLETDLYGVS